MSESEPETSLTAHEEVEFTPAPAPEEPDPAAELEEQERAGWLNEPTTG